MSETSETPENKDVWAFDGLFPVTTRETGSASAFFSSLFAMRAAAGGPLLPVTLTGTENGKAASQTK